MGGVDLHETEKKFSIYPPNKCIRTNKGYQSILDNLNIIIPLCSNCHREYHAGLIELPKRVVISTDPYIIKWDTTDE